MSSKEDLVQIVQRHIADVWILVREFSHKTGHMMRRGVLRGGGGRHLDREDG